MSVNALFASILSFDKLGKIYFQSFCRSLGRSLIRLFIPAYLLSNGFTLDQIVVQYYIISYLVWTMSAFGVIKIVESFTTRAGFLSAALLGILDSYAMALIITLVEHFMQRVLLSKLTTFSALAPRFSWMLFNMKEYGIPLCSFFPSCSVPHVLDC